ncbi:MAG TPA: ROK family protein [Acidobacteriaceae bacterium]
MRALAIDLGGTHANCAIVDGGKIIRSQITATNGSTDLVPLLPSLVEILKGLAERENIPLDCFAGLAFGFCGLVNGAECRVISTNAKYQDAPNLDLQTWTREQFNLPLYIENDARMALLGERYAGAAVGFDDVVMVTLGTGIGGAAMIGGQLLIGKHFQAGCLGGHLPVRLEGRRCTCGGGGCAESEAAGWSLPELCRTWMAFDSSALAQEEINFETLFRCADAGDVVSKAICNHCRKVWATNAIALIHAYDPELLVYGGGVMCGGDHIVTYLQDYVAHNAWTPWGKVQVRASQLGNDAALLGAIPLITGSQRSKPNV